MRRTSKPKPGQIDFTKARWCPVVNIVVKYRGKILIVRRSRGMRLYSGEWNGISGYLDDKKSMEEKVKEELRDELWIKARDIASIRVGGIFDVDDPRIGKTWVVHPVLATVKTDKIRLDWEAEEHRWIRPREVKKFKTVKGFRMVLARLFQQHI